MKRHEFPLYQDAICHSVAKIIGRLLDHVEVKVREERQYGAIEVRVTGWHRGKELGWCSSFSMLQIDANMYAEYLRERFPNEVGRRFADFIMRG